MPSLRHTIKMLKIPLLQDGVISLGETSLLLRAVRPFAQQGDGTACELRDLLVRVRQDGVVTHEESERVRRLMEKIVNGGVRLDQYVFAVQDRAEPGKTFYDTSRLLDTPWLFKMVLEMIGEGLADVKFDLVAAPSQRGVAFGAAIAARHGAGFVPICEPGQLPRETISENCGETGVLQMHADAVMRGERVLVVDALLATGETAAAAVRLVERQGGKVVRLAFPVELEGFKARENALKGRDVLSLVKYSH